MTTFEDLIIALIVSLGLGVIYYVVGLPFKKAFKIDSNTYNMITSMCWVMIIVSLSASTLLGGLV